MVILINFKKGTLQTMERMSWMDNCGSDLLKFEKCMPAICNYRKLTAESTIAERVNVEAYFEKFQRQDHNLQPAIAKGRNSHRLWKYRCSRLIAERQFAER